MIKGKLYERINEIEHFETGYSKLYTYSVIDMLNEAKKDIPKTIPIELINFGDKAITYSSDVNEWIKWAIKWFGDSK
jgi:hypothetical protein